MEQQVKNDIFFKAVMDNDLKAVLFDLDHGFDIEEKNEGGETALSIAAKFGCTKMVFMLLDKGANVNGDATCKTGNTPLMQAIVNGLSNNAIIETLIERGADVNHCNSIESTALLFAASAGNDYAAELLLSKGANIDAANEFLSTPIIMAAKHGHDRVVALLLDHGANYSTKDNSGLTALELAKEGERESVVSVFKSFFENRELDKLIDNQEENGINFKF